MQRIFWILTIILPIIGVITLCVFNVALFEGYIYLTSASWAFVNITILIVFAFTTFVAAVND